MSLNLEQLERAVERDAALLDQLPPIAVPHDLVARTKARVRGEVLRRAGIVGWSARRRWAIGFAAAAALVAALILPPAQSVDSDSDLDAWIDAMDASSAKLVAVVEQDSLPDEWRVESDADAELEAWSESLEASLDRFGAL